MASESKKEGWFSAILVVVSIVGITVALAYWGWGAGATESTCWNHCSAATFAGCTDSSCFTDGRKPCIAECVEESTSGGRTHEEVAEKYRQLELSRRTRSPVPGVAPLPD